MLIFGDKSGIRETAKWSSGSEKACFSPCARVKAGKKAGRARRGPAVPLRNGGGGGGANKRDNTAAAVVAGFVAGFVAVRALRISLTESYSLWRR